MAYKTALIFISALILSTSSCGLLDNEESVMKEKIGDVKLYTFSSDDQFFLSKALPFNLDSDTPLEEALNRLGRNLSESYFSETYADIKPEISFKVETIEKILYSGQSYKIAVINMIDKEQHAMRYFFQGSTGGQTTFSMIGATFIQPHLEKPLIDGLIMLYNDEPLPEMDHINLSGILTPRLVRYVAIRAIYSTQTKNIKMNLKKTNINRPGI